MVIRAAGGRWVVESRKRTENDTGTRGDPLVDLTFRREEREEESLELGWIPLSEPLTPGLARRFFELAGRRLWTDRRTGRRYAVELVVSGPDEGPGELNVRFARPEGAAATAPYPLGRPLGLVTGPELEAILDVARERSALGPSGAPTPPPAAPTKA